MDIGKNVSWAVVIWYICSSANSWMDFWLKKQKFWVRSCLFQRETVKKQEIEIDWDWNEKVKKSKPLSVDRIGWIQWWQTGTGQNKLILVLIACNWKSSCLKHCVQFLSKPDFLSLFARRTKFECNLSFYIKSEPSKTNHSVKVKNQIQNHHFYLIIWWVSFLFHLGDVNGQITKNLMCWKWPMRWNFKISKL